MDFVAEGGAGCFSAMMVSRWWAKSSRRRISDRHHAFVLTCGIVRAVRIVSTLGEKVSSSIAKEAGFAGDGPAFIHLWPTIFAI